MTPRITTTILPTPTSVYPISRLGLVNIVLLAALAVSLVWYLAQVNSIASAGWHIRDLQLQLTDLQSTRDTLIADAARFDDQQVLEQLAQHAGLVPAGSVAYLIQPQPVAAR